MKRLQRKMWTIGVAAAMAIALAGCGASSLDDENYTSNSVKSQTAATESYAYDSMANGAYYAEEAYDMSDAEWGAESAYDMDGKTVDVNVDESAANANNSRKLIRTVQMDVETLEFDRVMDVMQEQTAALGGYIENMNLYNGSRYSYYENTRSAYLVIRIPKNLLDGFLNTVSDISNVVNRSEAVEDVTLTYSDLESHKKVLEAEHARLLEFLEQAESIEEMLYIEDRLSEIQYQMESMESQLRTYDNKVDYSTVYLNVSEVKELTPVEEEPEQTAWERMKEGFLDNLFDILDGLKEFGIWFVANIPNLVLWAILIAVIVLILRRIIRKNTITEKTEKKTGKDFYDVWNQPAPKTDNTLTAGGAQTAQAAEENVGQNASDGKPDEKQQTKEK